MADKAPKHQRDVLSRIDFFFEDFLTGTDDLSADQGWIYIRLLCRMWSKGGSLPDDDKKLAHWCNVSQRKIRKVLPELMDEGFLQRDEAGRIFNGRAIYEMGLAEERRVKAADDGRRGGLKRAENERRRSFQNQMNAASSEDEVDLKRVSSEDQVDENPTSDSGKQEKPANQGQGSLEGSLKPPSPSPSPVEKKLTKKETSKGRTKKPKTQIPDGFPDSEAIVRAGAYFKDRGKPHIDPSLEADGFRSRSLRDEIEYRDWPQAFRNWCTNAVKWDKTKASAKQVGASRGTPGWISPEDWGDRVCAFRDGYPWGEDWGPEPDQPGCLVPPEILAKFPAAKPDLKVVA